MLVDLMSNLSSIFGAVNLWFCCWDHYWSNVGSPGSSNGKQHGFDSESAVSNGKNKGLNVFKPSSRNPWTRTPMVSNLNPSPLYGRAHPSTAGLLRWWGPLFQLKQLSMKPFSWRGGGGTCDGANDFCGDFTTICRGLTINKMGISVDVPHKWWLVDD